MVKKVEVPDAWDDDWESQADRINPDEEVRQSLIDSTQPQLPPPSQTKAERLAQHAEQNKKLWESAFVALPLYPSIMLVANQISPRRMDFIHAPCLFVFYRESTENTFHFLQASDNVPLATTFKPQVKVLSRRPVIAKRDPTTGLSHLSLDDEGEETKQEEQPTPEEIRAKQKREREEKQRRYDEARAKIFGEPSPSSGASSPGTVTPPRSDGQRTPRGRGRGRGGMNSQRSYERNNGESSSQFDSRRNTQPGPARELYDPSYLPKPDSPAQGRGLDSGPPSRKSTPRNEQPAIRAPRGPDGSGRGGFGFAKRGGKET